MPNSNSNSVEDERKAKLEETVSFIKNQPAYIALNKGLKELATIKGSKVKISEEIEQNCSGFSSLTLKTNIGTTGSEPWHRDRLVSVIFTDVAVVPRNERIYANTWLLYNEANEPRVKQVLDDIYDRAVEYKMIEQKSNSPESNFKRVSQAIGAPVEKISFGKSPLQGLFG